MQHPLISVIVPTFNRAEMLRAALESLACQHTDAQFTYEIIVVDNNSSDHTPIVIQEFSRRAPIPVRSYMQYTPGDAPPRNMGITQAHGEWLAFFDDDQLADPRWLLGLYQASLNTAAPIVGGPVFLALSPNRLARLGPICRKALREITFYQELQPYVGKDLPGTGNVLIARYLFDRLGLFSETMPNGGSDTDFFLRARAAGYALWYAPDAVIRHCIPLERLRPEYFRLNAYRGTESIASLDHQRMSRLTLLLCCLLRLGQAVLVHLPCLMWAWLRQDAGGVLGRRFLIWRAEGYGRRVVSLLAPQQFAQHEFFNTLHFRSGVTR